MRDLVKVFKALSDETMLRILNVLIERECCVCEVMQALKISQTRASRNLGILCDAGFLESRREGGWSFYSIASDAAQTFFPDLLGIVREGLEGNLAAELDKERLKKAEKMTQRCCGVVCKT